MWVRRPVIERVARLCAYQPRRVDARELRPPSALLPGQPVPPVERPEVPVGAAPLDPAVPLETFHDLATDVGAYQRERPVVERADAAGRDVSVLGREVRAQLAALASERVALLERDLDIPAVVHPDLQAPLDVHLLDLGSFQPVLGFEQLLEDCVVEGLRAKKADVERHTPSDLARPALVHDRRHGALAAHPDQREALGSALDRLVVRHRVGRVRVAAAGGGDDVLFGAGDAGLRLPGGPVTFEVRHERGVDDVALERVEQDRRYEAAVLADFGEHGIGGAGEHDVLRDAFDFDRLALTSEHELVDLGLPGPEARARPGAARAAFLALAAGVRPPAFLRLDRRVDDALLRV